MLYAGIDKVIVKAFENSNMTPGGIELPEKSVEPSSKGVVFGESDSFDESTIVYFRPYCGNKITYEGSDYFVLADTDILAYVEPESESDDLADL